MAGRAEDREGVAAELPPLDRAYQIDFRLLSDRLAEIPDEVNGILKLFDGRRTLAQVLAEAEHGGVAAAKVLARLWSEEIIRPAAAAPAGASPEARTASKPPVLVAPESGTAEPGPAEWFTGPDVAPQPAGEAGNSSQPAPAAGASGEAAGPAPRIVRFPARPKEPRAARGEVTAVRSLPAAPSGSGPVRPGRVAPRPARASEMRRRSATALLLAASLLAAVGIWRVVASRASGQVETRATSSPSSSTTSDSPAVQPSHPRDPAPRR